MSVAPPAPGGCGDALPSADPRHATAQDDPRRRWRDADGMHIDVRGLAPPGPLVVILQLVQAQIHAQAPDTPVIVHHDRDPQLLYPELAQIGWLAEHVPGEPGEVRLRLAPLP